MIYEAFLAFLRILLIMRHLFTLILAGSILIQCKQSPTQPTLKSGWWRATINIQGQDLPFNFEVRKDGGALQIDIINADERLTLDEFSFSGDTIDISLHIFDARIKAVIQNDSLKGEFIKNYETDYHIPFLAVHGQTHRFTKSANPVSRPVDFTGKYSVNFIHEFDTTRAIGIFNQIGDSVTGTFLTPTGDYRYLQGNVIDGIMHLSTFDGNHAFLFRASKREDQSLIGEFYSGKTWMEFWEATPNPAAVLPDAEKLTALKPGYETIEFSFPNPDGKLVALKDEKYKNKVVVLQLFGTWCPNCMDETQFLTPWYAANKNRGVEVIGLAFERKADFTYASDRVKKMIAKLGVPYDFVIAGTSNKEEASKALPMLTKVIAFPTTIFIGKDGKVKKIHTGFSGPGTGMYYDQFVEHFNLTINELLMEKSGS